MYFYNVRDVGLVIKKYYLFFREKWPDSGEVFSKPSGRSPPTVSYRHQNLFAHAGDKYMDYNNCLA
jgi:hypothetical protein